MTSDTLFSRIREKPFKSFRLNTSDGKHYDVTHPEMIYVGKSRIVVALYQAGENPDEEAAERDVVISPLHVASLEDLPTSTQRS